MGQQVDRASKRTTFSWGFASAPVALFKTTGDSALPEFEKAGPHGGRLKKEPRTRLVEKEVDTSDAPVPVTAEAVPDGVDLEASIRMHEADAERLRGVLAARTAQEPETYTATVEEGYDAEVTSDQIRRGLWLADGSFLDLTEELAAVDEQTQTDELRVVSFIRVEQIPRHRIQGSYYLGSDGPGAPKVLRLLYESMRRKHRLAVIKWTKSSRQALGILQPAPRRHGALEVLELAWASDWREPNSRCLIHQQAEVTERELEMATALVTAMSDSVASLDDLQDDRKRMYEELRAAAEEGDRVAIAPVPEAEPVSTVEDALRRSVERADTFAAVA